MIRDIFDTQSKGTDEPDGLIYPTLPDELYRELFSLADWMMQTYPWEKMGDFQSFVVEDPLTKSKQIAAVMGKGGSHFGLHLYQSPRGTHWYTRAQMGEGLDPFLQFLGQFEQDMLQVSFERLFDDVLDLHDEEIDAKYAPTNWSHGIGSQKLSALTLRSTRPGCAPWHPTEEEAYRMIDAMRLLKYYYENFFQEYESTGFAPEIIGDHAVASMPTFRLPAQANRNDPKAWEFQIEPIKISLERPEHQVLPDEPFLSRLTKAQVKPNTCWELGAIYVPQPIIHEGRPIYGMAAFAASRENGKVNGTQVSPATESISVILRNTVESTVAETGYLPAEFIVGSPIAEECLRDLAQEKGIELTPSLEPGDMSLFDDAANSFLDSTMPLSEQKEDLALALEDALTELQIETPAPDASEEETLAFMQKLEEFNPELMNQIIEQIDSDDDPPLPSYHPPQSRERYLFRVDLKGAKPPIWRRLSLPQDATFFDLHRAIQFAFGWCGYHLHTFESVGHTLSEFSIDWLGEDGQSAGEEHWMKETQVRLLDVFGKGEKSISYIYDFGDNWAHLIRLEKEIVSEGEIIKPYEVLKGKGANPIEDCGGIWGLQEIIDGTHPHLAEWPKEQIKKAQLGAFELDRAFDRGVEEEMTLLEFLHTD